MGKLRLFTPPIFDENEANRIAHLLSNVCWFTIISFCFLGIINAIFVPQNIVRTFTAIFGLTFSCFICLGILYFKKPRLACYFYIIQFWIFVTVLSITGGGIMAQAINAYLIIVLAAGLFLGTKQGFVTALVCILTEITITILGQEGLLPNSSLYISPRQYLMVSSFLIFMVIVFVYYYAKSIESLLQTYRLELSERKKIETENQKNIYALGERVKELTALHKFSIVLQEEKNIHSIIEKLVLIIPPSFQYPECTQVLIQLGNREAKTNGYFDSQTSLRTDFLTKDSKSGFIQVVYSDEKLTFINEEKELINTIALMLKTEYDRLLTSEELSKSEEQIRRAQRLDSLGSLASGIAHDLNNVLTPILLSIDMLRIKTQEPKTLSLIDLLGKSANRGKEIVKQVLTFARGSKQYFAPQNLQLLLKEITTFIEQTFPRKILLKLNTPIKPNYIMGDSTQLHQVLLNLCVNARDAMPNGGTLTLETANIHLSDSEVIAKGGQKGGDYVLLKVSDTGEGIPSEIKERLFEPFFTTKDVGKGTGLGLSTVHSIIREHKGFISFESIVNKGTEFTVYLPALLNENIQESEEKLEKLPSGNGELILVIEDELSILNITKETLVAFGYSVMTATDGIEALKYTSDNKGKIKLVLTNMDMPKFNGIETIKILRGIEKEAKVILTSGSLEDFHNLKSSDLNIYEHLRKPYTSAKLLQTIHGALKS